MSTSRLLPTGHPVINPDLAERFDRFQTALHARLQTVSAFDRAMIVTGLGLATCMEVGTTTAINVILPDMQGNVGATADQIIASRGEQDNWFGSLHLRIALVIGMFAIVGFIWRDSDRNNANPLLNLRLIVTQPAVAGGLVIAVVFGAMLGGGLYVLPQYLRTIQTYSATQTGGFFFIDGLASAGGFYIILKLVPRVPLFYLALTALILFIIGNFAFVNVLTGDTPGAVICIILILHGVSTGMLLPGVSMMILPRIDLRLISFGTATYIFSRNLGTSIGVSAVLALIDIRQTLHSSRLLDIANRLDPRVIWVT